MKAACPRPIPVGMAIPQGSLPSLPRQHLCSPLRQALPLGGRVEGFHGGGKPAHMYAPPLLERRQSKGRGCDAPTGGELQHTLPLLLPLSWCCLWIRALAISAGGEG